MIVFALKHHVQCCNHKCDQKRAVHHSDVADCDGTEHYDHRGFTRAYNDQCHEEIIDVITQDSNLTILSFIIQCVVHRFEM